MRLKSIQIEQCFFDTLFLKINYVCKVINEIVICRRLITLLITWTVQISRYDWYNCFFSLHYSCADYQCSNYSCMIHYYFSWSIKQGRRLRDIFPPFFLSVCVGSNKWIIGNGSDKSEWEIQRERKHGTSNPTSRFYLFHLHSLICWCKLQSPVRFYSRKYTFVWILCPVSFYRWFFCLFFQMVGWVFLVYNQDYNTSRSRCEISVASQVDFWPRLTIMQSNFLANESVWRVQGTIALILFKWKRSDSVWSSILSLLQVCCCFLNDYLSWSSSEMSYLKTI